MELRTVKEIAILRSQLGPLQRQAAERLGTVVKQAKADAIAQFKTHFTKAGFTVSGESRRYVAAYEDMQFFLEITETPGAASFFKFSLQPPTGLGEAKQAVQMMRRDFSSVAPAPGNAEPVSGIAAAEKELADARTTLSMSSPEFCFVVVDEPGDPIGNPRVDEAPTAVFKTFGNFLEASYPN